METEQKLRTAVQWIPTEQIDVDLELFAEANVSTPEPVHSHRPLNRFVELVEDASSARGFGIATLAPMSAERLFQKAAGGMDTEIIYPSAVLKDNLLSNPRAAEDAIKRGHLTPMVHEYLPCGLYIFDDRVILGGYNLESGVLRVVVDTDDPEAIDWADSVYTTYRREAEPFDPDTLPTTSGGNHVSESN
jgi:predicted transcriptional regulator